MSTFRQKRMLFWCVLGPALLAVHGGYVFWNVMALEVFHPLYLILGPAGIGLAVFAYFVLFERIKSNRPLSPWILIGFILTILGYLFASVIAGCMGILWAAVPYGGEASHSMAKLALETGLGAPIAIGCMALGFIIVARLAALEVAPALNSGASRRADPTATGLPDTGQRGDWDQAKPPAASGEGNRTAPAKKTLRTPPPPAEPDKLPDGFQPPTFGRKRGKPGAPE